MDVFISEEYVNRRRMEKKAAAVAGKGMRLGSASSKRPEKRNSYPCMSESPPDNEFRVSGGGVYESFVFHCFSP
ncbi:unnamed protein product [Arabidopsis lyrata]|uniref:Uncharacterized protein n=1 Tax=Arabidopsis lyrata subsp. lyrata TaxID=81972 RepID=D7KPD1_ARALL|nr:uncharacterized protein LOC9328777 [Arabidopsis lyrata subsp. lyrata]EFH66230.1 hypothetical protein ARALYDRAFT_471434 [Arabidopsis lyrata subsp. lyrata]CAH8252119.1 unnamed protein product [Arabidopsis lyrata]|eukprot:XP_020869540.1 uncharacterized protein LOC9328777 [Arabidopsis lyrata subsp. lyrata]